MCIKASPRLALAETELRTSHRSLLLPCNNLPINIPSKTGQKRERRVRKDKCNTARQIPLPQAEDLYEDCIPGSPVLLVGCASSLCERTQQLKCKVMY